MPPPRFADDALLLPVRVQPRASREKIVGRHGEALKVALTAPPVEGAANKALCALLAKQLGVAKSAANIAQGESSRDKVVRIEGVARATAAAFCRQWELPPPQ